MLKARHLTAWSCLVWLMPVYPCMGSEPPAQVLVPVAHDKNAEGAAAESASEPATHAGDMDATEDDAQKDAKRRRRHPHHHRTVESTVVLPSGLVPLTFAGELYYYGKGVFYQLAGSELMIAPVPVGAIVPSIPTLRERVEVDGAYYNVINGIYYQIVPGGYQVVAPPEGEAPQQAYTVHVPTGSGEYTAVTVTRSRGGFTGPQGEFYPRFPKVEQLQVMYGQ